MKLFNSIVFRKYPKTGKVKSNLLHNYWAVNSVDGRRLKIKKIRIQFFDGRHHSIWNNIYFLTHGLFAKNYYGKHI